MNERLSANQKALLAESNRKYHADRLHKNNINVNPYAYQLRQKTKDLAEKMETALQGTSNMLEDILAEPRTVKIGEQELKINSIKDIYSEFKKHVNKPWHEIDREHVGPSNHFIMYAVHSGVKLEEIVEYVKNPESEIGTKTKEKLVSLRDDYIKMVATEDLDKCFDITVSYGKAYRDQLPGLYGKIKNMNDVADNLTAIYAMGNIQSLLSQDYNYKGSEPQTEKIDAKFKEAGENMTYDSLYFASRSLLGYMESIRTTAVSLKHEEMMLSPEISEWTIMGAVYGLRESNKLINDAVAGDLIKYQDAFTKIASDTVANYQSFAGKKWDSVNPAELDLVDSLELKPSDFDDSLADDFLGELNSNKRTNIFGRPKADSELYTAVKENLDKYIRNKNGALNMDRGNLEDLKASCEKYLEERDPSSKDGKERYKLVNKVLNFANHGLSAAPTTNLDRHNKFEKANIENAARGAEATKKYEATTNYNLNKKLSIAEKTRERFEARHAQTKGDEHISKFLDGIEDDLGTVEYGKEYKDLLKDDLVYNDVKHALARLQTYELLRCEYDPNSQTFNGYIADEIRAGRLDEFVEGMARTNINRNYLNSKENNLEKFINAKPSAFVQEVVDSFAQNHVRMEDIPVRNVQKEAEPTISGAELSREL